MSVIATENQLREFFPNRRKASKHVVELVGAGRDELAHFFGLYDFKVGAEIGVEQGKFAETLCRCNPKLHLYCVDAWKAYRGYREHVSQEKLDEFFALTRSRLGPYNCTLLRKFSTDAAAEVRDGSLDFVYIDGNHSLLHVIQDLYAWVPKVRPGGIVAGHDYCRRKQSGYQVHVVEAVEAYTQAFHISPYYVLGAKEVRDGQVRDRPRSYLWVNGG